MEAIKREEFVRELCRFMEKHLITELPSVGTNRELFNKAYLIIVKKLKHIRRSLGKEVK